ncbi:BadF/BadG/BcrA/BcrD ATPase family protein [Novosphingobium sp. 9]|uniref:BadF/BadG/BcrA/BcrD ATPase family protein n=1 Tax=Novosphingobium sp. 9 TaxID=2025349 RepID=UPI0021B64ED5|nr:BadF/BadG/BcrA/BcrD ATPase family protein [Novosphingobium sp. 9]
MTYFLGIDAGGSHCRARLVDHSGTVLGSGSAGPANAGIGLDALFAALEGVIAQALGEAGLGSEQARAVQIGMGIAGITRPGVREAIAGHDFGLGTVTCATDAMIANLGAHRGADGAVLIVGTGSIAQLRVEGRDFAIGGYGFPISDEGSGAALGLSAMRHALRALDGRTRRTALSEAVTEGFEHDTARAIAWMDHATPRDYGAFAPLVMAHAQQGDVIARSIVEDAAGHIERFIETVFERGAVRCALVGGLAPHMRPWLRARTVAKLTDPLGDSLDGALLLAGFDPAG